MQTLKTLCLAMVLPLFAVVATGADADEAKPPAKPTLTYYFFDG